MLEWLSQSIVAQALTRFSTLYILVNAAHILSIGILVGAILPLDLRLLGFFRTVRLDALGPFLARSAKTGVVLAIVTGTLLFVVRADAYAENPAFLIKLVLLGFGIANALLLHASSAWQLAITTDRTPLIARSMAALSILIWTAAVVSGRWIGFV